MPLFEIGTLYKFFKLSNEIKNLLIERGVDYWQVQTANVRGRMPKEWAINAEDYYNFAKFVKIEDFRCELLKSKQ